MKHAIAAAVILFLTTATVALADDHDRDHHADTHSTDTQHNTPGHHYAYGHARTGNHYAYGHTTYTNHSTAGRRTDRDDAWNNRHHSTVPRAAYDPHPGQNRDTTHNGDAMRHRDRDNRAHQDRDDQNRNR